MTGKALPDGDHISRYCRPGTVQDNVLLPAAFEISAKEDHLSVNWIEYFKELDLAEAIDRIRTDMRITGYTIRPSGLFVVLNVRDAKTAIYEAVGDMPRIEHRPQPKNELHAGIFGYTSDSLKVAGKLAMLHSSKYPGA